MELFKFICIQFSYDINLLTYNANYPLYFDGKVKIFLITYTHIYVYMYIYKYTYILHSENTINNLFQSQVTTAVFLRR